MVTSLHHTAITVSDLDRAIDFYVGILGAEVLSKRDHIIADYARAFVGFADADLRTAMLKVPGGSKLELVEYLQPAGRPAQTQPNSTGSMHVAFVVDDIDTLYRDLSSKGVRFRSEPQVSTEGPSRGNRMFYAFDPDGALLEFIQPAAQA